MQLAKFTLTFPVMLIGDRNPRSSFVVGVGDCESIEWNGVALAVRTTGRPELVFVPGLGTGEGVEPPKPPAKPEESKPRGKR